MCSNIFSFCLTNYCCDEVNENIQLHSYDWLKNQLNDIHCLILEEKFAKLDYQTESNKLIKKEKHQTHKNLILEIHHKYISYCNNSEMIPSELNKEKEFMEGQQNLSDYENERYRFISQYLTWYEDKNKEVKDYITEIRKKNVISCECKFCKLMWNEPEIKNYIEDDPFFFFFEKKLYYVLTFSPWIVFLLIVCVFLMK